MADYKYYFKGVNGQITIYEDRVIIERGGVLGFFSQGLAGAKTIPMGSIMTVQFREGNWLNNGFIQFGILGGIESRGGILDASKDENTVMIKPATNDDARAIKNYVERIILNRSKIKGTVVQQASPTDELKKFKELLDMGAISQAEFDAKKKQLLGL